MYISRQTYEGDNHTVTPYKEFPTDILLENITCLLNEQSSSELESLKNLESMLRHTNTRVGKLITFDEKVDNWKLKEKVTTKIVSETKHQYQIEVDGNFYNVSKSDVE